MTDDRISADDLVTLYLIIRRLKEETAVNEYRDHPFCQRLRKLMLSAYRVQGLTFEKMTEEIGIGRSSMSTYYSGLRLPGAENLIKLADYFGVSTDYLLGREGYELEENNESC